MNLVIGTDLIGFFAMIIFIIGLNFGSEIVFTFLVHIHYFINLINFVSSLRILSLLRILFLSFIALYSHFVLFINRAKFKNTSILHYYLSSRISITYYFLS
jgi:hypothetical protein